MTNRVGTVDTRASLGELDTSAYDNKLAQLQSEYGNIKTDPEKLAQLREAVEDSKTNFKEGDRNYLKKAQAERALENYQKDIARQQALKQQEINAWQQNKDKYLQDYANKRDLDASTSQYQQAQQSAMLDESAKAQANRQANITAGINRSQAGMLGSQAAGQNTANQANQIYQANSAGAASTQADYLEKMGQSKAMDVTADAKGKAATMAGISGALQGIGSGASVGAALATSDETQKEDPTNKREVDPEELNRAIAKLKDLYRQLKELKQ